MRTRTIALLACSSALGMAALAQMDTTSKDDKQTSVAWQGGMLLETSVHDIEHAIAFYTETLGFELEFQIEEYKWARFITPSGITLGMKEVDPDQPTGTGTLSLNLTVPDADEARAILEAKGVVFDGPTYTIPGIVRLAPFSDPFGNRFKLAGPPKQTLTETEP